MKTELAVITTSIRFKNNELESKFEEILVSLKEFKILARYLQVLSEKVNIDIFFFFY
jgi:hypothetical protein